MGGWVTRELVRAEFGDQRLTERLMRIVEDLSEHPEASIPQASGRGAKATYRFLDNPRVQAQRILEPHRQRTIERAADFPVVLVAQDTTEINLTSHSAANGLGYLGAPGNRGLLLHSLVCLSPDGTPLGVLDQFSWVRPPEKVGQRKTRDQRSVLEKESRKWLDGLAAVERHLSQQASVVLIGDRESDLYDLFAAPRAAQVELLVRVRELRRCLAHPAHQLQAALAATPAAARVTIELPRSDDRASRQAVLTLRWCSLTIRRPANYRGPCPGDDIPLSFLEAREEQPPAGCTPIRWVLATTLNIASLEDALRILAYYQRRWLCERFHYVLKSGCHVERHQLREAPRIENLIATLSIVAWHVLWMTHEARREPVAPCTCVLNTDQWHVLHLATQPRCPLPSQPPTLREAIRAVAKLGGFLGRKGDGEPGVKTIWKGYRRLIDLVAGYHLARAPTLPTLAPLIAREDYG